MDRRRAIAELNRLLPYVREYQQLATHFGIDDVFQDNGGKLLQFLIATGLTNLPGREGNDATDADGNECELKTVNLLKQKTFTTHHHLNHDIIAKYRGAVWYFGTFEAIELKEIYYLTPDLLEPWFTKWEEQLDSGRAHLNNPKIPLKFVKQHGKLCYRTGERTLWAGNP